MPFQEKLNILLKTGISPNQSFTDKRDILFTNMAAFALTVASILVTIAYLSFGFYFGALIPVLVALLLNVAYPLQRLGYNFLEKIAVW